MAKGGNSIRGALSLTFIQRAVSVVFNFGSVTIISRLLTPSEIGIFSIAVGFVTLVHMLRDFGVTEFVIQEKHLDETLIRTVFTMNLLIAWVLAAVVVAISGPVGHFYGDPGVAHVLRVMSLVFVMFPFGTTTMALMRRDMKFGTLAKVQIGGTVTRSCTAVALAYAGFSYMSMAWAALAGLAAVLIGCLLWGWDYRVRGLALSQWKRVASFGSFQTVSDIAYTIGDQTPNLIIGRMLGMAATGFFSRGYGVVNLFRSNVVSAVGTVFFSAYAQHHREGGGAPELYRRSLVYLTAISWPFFACGAILAAPIIFVLFGSQWGAAVPLMRWMCAAAIIGTLTYECNALLVGIGRVRAATDVRLKFVVVQIILVVAAAFHGLDAVAAAQVPVYVVATALYYRKTRCYPSLRAGSFARALLPSVWVTIATCVVPAALVMGLPDFTTQHKLAALVLAIAGGGLGWIVAIVGTKHPLMDEIRRLVGSLFVRVTGFQRP